MVAIRFGHDHDPDCMAMDEALYSVSEKVQNFCVIYLGTCCVAFLSLRRPLPPFWTKFEERVAD